MKRYIALVIVILLIILSWFAFSPPEHSLAGGYAYGEQYSYAQLEQAYLNLFSKYNQLLALRDDLYFDSEQELADFLFDDLSYTRQYDVNKSTCVQLAESLQERALEKGKLLNIDVLTAEQYLKWYGVTASYSHVVCSAVVDGRLYYIEPSDNHYWSAYYWEE